MDVLDALQESATEAGWDAYRLSREVHLREGAVYKWLRKESIPSGTAVIILMNKLPGFAQRLGFQAFDRVSSSAA